MGAKIIESILGLTILFAIFSCMVVILMKIYYHYKYLAAIQEEKQNQNEDVKANIPILIAPIFVRDKEKEGLNKDLAKLGRTIKNLLIVFFCLISYALIVSQLI